MAVHTGEPAAPPSPPDAGGDDLVATDVGEPAPFWTAWRVVAVVVAVTLLGIGVGAFAAQRVGTPGPGSVDVGFLEDMRSHHSQAVEMANLVDATASDQTVRDFAREVLIFQQYEVGYMEALLEEWGHFPPDPGRTAMTWMGMSTPVDQMPGMQPEARMRRLQDARGAEADALFLQMMTEHHRGGIHMAEYAVEHAQDQRVRDLARRMASTQRAEIAEYQRLAQRLGVSLEPAGG